MAALVCAVLRIFRLTEYGLCEKKNMQGACFMKLLIVRHGDPDYAKDSLTEKGWREARYLSERLIKMGIDIFDGLIQILL